MDMQEIYEGILDSYPYPIVFVDDSFTIRYLNQNARYHYYQERGYGDLLGKSIFACHRSDEAKEKIRKAFASIRENGKPIYLGVSTQNQRIYIQGVKNKAGKWIGFFERFELNLQK
jgi:DUF438 domain-containing protein